MLASVSGIELKKIRRVQFGIANPEETVILNVF